MRTELRLAAASLAAATLVATAAGATAAPIDSAPTPGPLAEIAEGTGSSALDSIPAGVDTGSYYLQQGNVIGLLALLVNLPFAIVFGDVCEWTTGSAWDPCGRPGY
ncbi:hypothetical protein [Nocardia higoensis]|uniref:hypothetical protein n=1 Tax=Nocardia higoensis TaxID=228599 RepID=UPI0002D9CF33|nr:hypothetical protein [Nocardia higoensis]